MGYTAEELKALDGAENKLTFPDCPKVLWAQRFLGRSDWQVSENVTYASKGVMEAEKFVNERELREAVGEVEKLREVLTVIDYIALANKSVDPAKITAITEPALKNTALAQPLVTANE